MAPRKYANQNKCVKTSITTRSRNEHLQKVVIETEDKSKRKANSPPKKDQEMKRSALGNITNALTNQISVTEKNTKNAIVQDKQSYKTKLPKYIVKSLQTKEKPKTNAEKSTKVQKGHSGIEKVPLVLLDRGLLEKEKKQCEKASSSGISIPVLSDCVKILETGKLAENITSQLKEENKQEFKVPYDSENDHETSSRKSVDDRRFSDALSDAAERSSLYETALEDLSLASTSGKCASGEKSEVETTLLKNVSPVKEVQGATHSQLPDGVENFDEQCIADPCQASEYAMDIFAYMKERELKFKIHSYMDKQETITIGMRAILVDWLVEIQESFELNHETLYLGVKLTDMYLSKFNVPKGKLQLVGATALFIASKYDERVPPLADDFSHICDYKYSHREIIRMEIDILKAINFDLGIPLSYRFLRRYARVSKMSMSTLTLARYILELSLMDYSLISESDSKLAAAALFLALKIRSISNWTPTLEYYSGYTVSDIRPLAITLNHLLHKQQRCTGTIKTKYSHRIFFEVAKLPLIDDAKLKD